MRCSYVLFRCLLRGRGWLVKVGLGRFPGYLLALDAEREGPPDDVVFGFGPGRLLVLDAEREGPPVEASLG